MRLPILRDRNLAVLFAGQAINVFGSTMLLIVLPIWVKDLTGSTSAAGSVFQRDSGGGCHGHSRSR